MTVLERLDDPTKDEKLEAFVQTNKDFQTLLVSARLYVPPALWSRVNALRDDIVAIASKFTLGRGFDKIGEPLTFQDLEAWMQAVDAVRKQVIPVYEEIVAEFQKRIGVSDK